MIHGSKLEGSKGIVTGFLKDTNEYIVSIVINGLSYEMGVLGTNISVLDDTELMAQGAMGAPPPGAPLYPAQTFAAGMPTTAAPGGPSAEAVAAGNKHVLP